MIRLIVPIEKTKGIEKNEVTKLESEAYLGLVNSMLRSCEIQSPSMPVSLHLAIRTVGSNEVLVVEEYLTNLVDITFSETRLRIDPNEKELGYSFLMKKIKELLDFYFGEDIKNAMFSSVLQPIGVSIVDHKMYGERLVVHFIIYIEEQYKYLFEKNYPLIKAKFFDIDEAYNINKEIEPFAYIVKPKLTIVGGKKCD